MRSPSQKTTSKAARIGHQAMPSRNSWDQSSASEVKPQHTLFDLTKQQGQPSYTTRSLSASRFVTVSPDGHAMSISQNHRSSWRRNGKRQGSDGLGEGWIVRGLILNEGPQDMQELVHQDTQSLHLRERILLPPLQIGIELSKMWIVLYQA
jgi:hypothetical protein